MLTLQKHCLQRIVYKKAHCRTHLIKNGATRTEERRLPPTLLAHVEHLQDNFVIIHENAHFTGQVE